MPRIFTQWGVSWMKVWKLPMEISDTSNYVCNRKLVGKERSPKVKEALIGQMEFQKLEANESFRKTKRSFQFDKMTCILVVGQLKTRKYLQRSIQA